MLAGWVGNELSLFNSNYSNASGVVIPTIRWNILRDDEETFVCGDAFFEEDVWTHVVLTASGEECRVYKDGVLKEVSEKGFEPNRITRDKHLIGAYKFASQKMGGFMRGVVAVFRSWQNMALSEKEVGHLFTLRKEQDSLY